MPTEVPARERVFRYVRDRLVRGAPPTVREVQEAMGYGAVESARKQLEALVAEGRLAKDSGRARGYRLPHETPNVTAVSILGRIQAGDLTAAVQDPDGVLAVETRHSPERLFALRVRGDSMTERGIFEGDVVVVLAGVDPEPGQIVVACVDGEATVKTFRRRGREVILEPANPAFRSMSFDAGEVEVLGRVVEVRRSIH
ncbi:MAG: transcriptional repressor LexA [Planctomycetota bacterium]